MGRAFPGGIGPVRGSSSLVFCLGESCGGEVVCRRRGCGQREESGNARGGVGGFGPLLWGDGKKRGASSYDRMRSAVGHRGGGRTDPWEGGVGIPWSSFSGLGCRPAPGEGRWGSFVGAGLAPLPLSGSRAFGSVRPEGGRTARRTLGRGGSSGRGVRLLREDSPRAPTDGQPGCPSGRWEGRAGGGWERWPGSTRCSGLSGRGGSSSRSVRMRAPGRPMRESSPK